MLALGTAEFFAEWRDLMTSLFEQARSGGWLRGDADSESLSLLMISVIEGALLMCKASGDVESFKKTANSLKQTLCLYRADMSGSSSVS